MAKKGPKLKQFCPRNHDTFVTGRYPSSRRCIECNREDSRIYPHNPISLVKQICVRGHDTFKCGRTETYNCKDCVKEDGQSEENKIQCLEYYYLHHKEMNEYNKKWIKEHPQLVRARKIKQQTNRNLRIVAWTDWDKINQVYLNCPDSMQTDHYIALQGKLVSGLHVSWNLQYLTIEANQSKNNKVDLIEVSDWYGKILEEVGLKDKKLELQK